jgi:transposase
MKHIESGNGYKMTALLFDISERSIIRWRKRWKDLGHCNAKKNLGKKPRVSNEEFIKYVELHPDETLKEIGAYFGMTNVGALYYMRKTGIRYKKKSLATGKPVKKKGENI